MRPVFGKNVKADTSELRHHLMTSEEFRRKNSAAELGVGFARMLRAEYVLLGGILLGSIASAPDQVRLKPDPTGANAVGAGVVGAGVVGAGAINPPLSPRN